MIDTAVYATEQDIRYSLNVLSVEEFLADFAYAHYVVEALATEEHFDKKLNINTTKLQKIYITRQEGKSIIAFVDRDIGLSIAEFVTDSYQDLDDSSY